MITQAETEEQPKKQASFLMPLTYHEAIEEIFWSERRESRTDVFLELLALGLAVKRGEYVKVEEVETI